MVDLPVVGAQRLWAQGLTCVDPGLQRRGVASNLPGMTRRGMGANCPTTRTLRVTPIPRRCWAHSTSTGRPGLATMSWSSPPPIGQPARNNETSRGRSQHISAARTTTMRGGVRVGPGHPVGDAVVEIQADENAWALFEAVDRSRGDTLLGLHWVGDPPDGWFS